MENTKGVRTGINRTKAKSEMMAVFFKFGLLAKFYSVFLSFSR
jgi:hypothetical protein